MPTEFCVGFLSASRIQFNEAKALSLDEKITSNQNSECYWAKILQLLKYLTSAIYHWIEDAELYINQLIIRIKSKRWIFFLRISERLNASDDSVRGISLQNQLVPKV